MKITLLTQWFDPEPTFKGLVFAKELQKQGHEVEVITGFPNYPGGKVYPGFKIKLYQKEVVEGVTVTRLLLYPSHDKSAIGRIFNYISFMLSVCIYGLFFMKRADRLYAYHPPLTVGVAAAIIRLIRRIPVVYVIQDMWPDTLRATGMIRNDRLLKFISMLCKFVYKRVDKIVVLSPGFEKLLIERGVPAAKISVIYNWADEQSLCQTRIEPLPQFSDSDKFHLLFAGNMGRAQALDNVIDAAVLLRTRAPTVMFVMIGGGLEVDGLTARANALGLTNIMFVPPVPMAEIGKYLRSADALLVHLSDDPLFRITIPSKTQAYMAVGKPILMAVEGDAAHLINDAGCGICTVSQDADALANAIVTMSEMNRADLIAMGDNGARYYYEKLGVQAGVANFIKQFEA